MTAKIKPVSREQFERAFNKAAAHQDKLARIISRMGGKNSTKLDKPLNTAKKKLKAAFSSKAGKMPADKLFSSLQKAKTSANSAYTYVVLNHMFTNIVDAIPALKKAEEKAILEAKERREKEQARQDRAYARKQKPTSLSHRVATLEQENTSLRTQVNTRPQTAEEAEREREEWARVDAGRMGGSSAPRPWNWRE